MGWTTFAKLQRRQEPRRKGAAAGPGFLLSRRADCAQLRAAGSNEISGVIPDLLVRWRFYDSPARAAALLMTVLPQAVDHASALR